MALGLTIVQLLKQPSEVFCKVFLEISQNSQKIIYTRVSFLIKLQAEPWTEFHWVTASVLDI